MHALEFLLLFVTLLATVHYLEALTSSGKWSPLDATLFSSTDAAAIDRDYKLLAEEEGHFDDNEKSEQADSNLIQEEKDVYDLDKNFDLLASVGTETDATDEEKRNFNPRSGKRVFTPWGGKRAFNPWGGKRAFNPWGGKRAFNPWGGKRAVDVSDDKRAFNPWGGKRAFNPWGGKRSYTEQLLEKKAFNPWGGKRAFNPWGGKRNANSEMVKMASDLLNESNTRHIEDNKH